MRITDDLDFGVDTHTGRVRTTNEDDYLAYCPAANDERAAIGLLFVIADGMGGASGGAEASRAAVRALAMAFVEAPPHEAPEARMTRAFASACARLYRLAKEQPRLKDMGTTLTAVNLLGDRVVVGHVGDSRCLLLRGENLRQLTVDHAVRRAEHQLVRCVGAGREREDADVMTHPVEPGDVLVLATDGLWDAVDAVSLAQTLRRMPAQAAAHELVRLAIEAGGADNATAIVVGLRACGDPAARALTTVEPPQREGVRLPMLQADLPKLRRPMWPLAALAVAIVVGSWALVRVLLRS
ncbi:MAG: protein phosphatase 2C domain-containing protein [Planctomycetota bacterium]